MQGPLLGLQWGGGFAFFLSFFLLLSALPLYARELGAADAAIGIIMGCFAVTAMLLRPWTGWAADRYGRRPLMLAGATVFLVSSLAYSIARDAVGLALVRLLHGAGMGLYPTAASAMVADLAPPHRRGEFLGLFGAAGSLAMALGPITGIVLVERLGFASLFLVSGAVALVALGLTLAVRETLATAGTRPFSLAGTLSPSARLPSLVMFFLMVPYGTQVTFVPLHADAHGVNPGVFFLVYALILTLLRGPAGRLSDRVGRAPVAAGGLGVGAAALVVLALSEGLTGLALAGGLFGVAFGAAQPALIAWCVDGAAPGDRGRAMGTFFTALELGIAVGAMSSGPAVARWGAPVAFLANAAVALTGAALAIGIQARRP
jgi:MFS family permease